MADDFILIEGARQNNLKGIDLRLPLNELIVFTGVSGSGKSSLALDTIYSEGQRRYVETFSPYARQFLERMDRAHADRVEGIPPAIAIDQTNPVRTSRSTVGTMTELNDHIKLLFSRAAHLHCRGCARRVHSDSPETIYEQLKGRIDSSDSGDGAPKMIVTFTLPVPKNFTQREVKDLLMRQGYTRIHRQDRKQLEVIQDRIRPANKNRSRIIEGLAVALQHGQGCVNVYPLDNDGKARLPWRFSSDLHCPDCDIRYHQPVPNSFSFNSPIGACETCRGFGRTIGIDDDLVVPNADLSLAEGAVRPWQTASYRDCQDDLMRFARQRDIPTNVPWRKLKKAQQQWVLRGEGDWEDGKWYGVKRFFKWLETKGYKMHIRVLLSKYRAYNRCPACGGARLNPDSLLWRLGTLADADRVVPLEKRFMPTTMRVDRRKRAALPGLTVHDLMLLPIDRCRDFFQQVQLPTPLDEATQLLLKEIRSRLRYLVDVGLGYLTLDRQSRTLSGGEVQRINLTTALGTSLVNALFVLDEPSIGLHARDTRRVIRILHRLRDAGNSLVVVEHDPHIMLAADRILDLGPGPGQRGGQVVFFGTPRELLKAKRSLTAKYLRGEKVVGDDAMASNPPDKITPWLEIVGAAQHNLKEIDVKIPLNRLVCITGVSGSGKSTLVKNVVYSGLCKLKQKPTETPGRHKAIVGHDRIDDVVLVDQTPIGKTTRSNPASYVGALGTIRKLFAAEPLAQQRKYTAGTFSFNSGAGRCTTCSGNGFQRVEMQFLSDVYLRCQDCNGRRYRSEVLDVKLMPSRLAKSDQRRSQPSKDPRRIGPAKSIADVLELTVSEAVRFFAAHDEVLRTLEPLVAIGLDYLRLGQPVPTLSGGEAQRLKLAGHLAKARRRKQDHAGTLLLFDEPTTGLHFDDIATLLRAFQQLIKQGHSLVVIEHNLDVIRAADWIIDLGPEGGDAGGEVVFVGTPEQLTRSKPNYKKPSHTGAALRNDSSAMGSVAHPAKRRENGKTKRPQASNGAIRIRNAREHNLKGINIKIPRDRFTVITGVSGSGKSTVAFDILFAEGQRRYLESLNAYARQFVQPASHPDVDAISGIPPAVAIEQRTSRGGRKSTVATMTEIYHFLRLLFVKLGTQFCPDCSIPIEVQTSEAILSRIVRDFRGCRVSLLAPLVLARKGYYTELAKWASGKGFAGLRVDGKVTSTADWPRLNRYQEHNIELPIGEVTAGSATKDELRALVDRALELGNGVVQVARARRQKGSKATRAKGREAIFSTQRACPRCGNSFEELDPRLFSFNSKHGWCPRCFGTGLILTGFDEEQTGEETCWNQGRDGQEQVCPACQGQRLKPDGLAVQFHDYTIAELTALSVGAAEKLFTQLRLHGREATISHDILPELRARLKFLKHVGLSYLQLDRAAPTLSGGEAQRIRLASQLGSNLRGVCYILDEPTIGLHARDNRMLLKTLQSLEAKGNTVVVVEHDEDTIRQAEHIVDLGPGAGVNGGRIVAEGSIQRLLKSPKSITGRLLSNPLRHPLVGPRRRIAQDQDGSTALDIVGAQLHNLKNLHVVIPLRRLVCVTGVSGSGKSTLVRKLVHDQVQELLSAKRSRRRRRRLNGCTTIKGWESIRRVLEVDQRPIGKTPRSCPATYVGFWDPIRRLFAGTAQSRMRGYGPSRFSFNVPGGRCDECNGQGLKKIEMSFLPNVKVTCESCGGSRFNTETLAVRFKDYNIGEVLAMSVDEAADFFTAHTSIHHSLQLLKDVGLGYLTLGQQSPTLSGGEAQRIKLVTELSKVSPPATSSDHTLYVLDEPTIGLHMADVEKLIRVLHRLVEVGNSVVVIEHNLDIVAEADWVIDLGPEGGDGGGRIVAQGSPETVARVRRGSHTARTLNRFLKERCTK